jgi:hypothetical protein
MTRCPPPIDRRHVREERTKPAGGPILNVEIINDEWTAGNALKLFIERAVILARSRTARRFETRLRVDYINHGRTVRGAASRRRPCDCLL